MRVRILILCFLILFIPCLSFGDLMSENDFKQEIKKHMKQQNPKDAMDLCNMCIKQYPKYNYCYKAHVQILNVLIGDVSLIRKFLSDGGSANATYLKVGKGYVDEGVSLLHFTAGEGNVEAIKYLIDNGADMYAKTAAGRTVMGAAEQSGHLNAVMTLLEYNYQLRLDGEFTSVIKKLQKQPELAKSIKSDVYKRYPENEVLAFFMEHMRPATQSMLDSYDSKRPMIVLDNNNNEMCIEYRDKAGNKNCRKFYNMKRSAEYSNLSDVVNRLLLIANFQTKTASPYTKHPLYISTVDGAPGILIRAINDKQIEMKAIGSDLKPIKAILFTTR